MTDRPRFITAEGFARIRAEYEQLFGERAPQAGRDDQLGGGQWRPLENGDYIYGRKRCARSTGGSASCPR
jgi:transcription elongation factor GreB